MLKAARSFYNNWKIAKALDAFVRVSVVLSGAYIAEQALESFLSPQALYAEESRPERLPKQMKARHQLKYDMKIRESLDLQQDFGNPASSFQTLENLFSKIKEKIKPKSKYNKEEAVEALKVMSDVLKEEGKFEYRENSLLIEGLREQENGKRFIDCDDYSFIYLVAGEILGLPLEPVYIPKHVFLLCRLDDSTHFYWEPTVAEEKDIDFYKAWLNVPEGSSYPKVLSENEFEAIQYCNLGLAWYEKGDFEKAIEYYERAIKLNPNYAAAFNNIGVAYAKKGNFDKAMECYKKAISINPNYATPFSNIGVAFYRLGHLKKAIDYFEKAAKADPAYDRAYTYKVVALVKNGEYKKALKFLKKIRGSE